MKANHLIPMLMMAVTPLALLTVPATSVGQERLAPAAARMSNATVRADHDAYKATQARIRTLNEQGVRVDNYSLSKAQCWLDTSFHEYTRNDRGGYPQAALNESVAIVSALEEGRSPDSATPLVNGAEKLRPDLWQRFEALRSDSGWRCAAQAAACGEVELVHAGNEMKDGGWRHANPYVQIAEDYLERAQSAAASCPPPVVASAPRAMPRDIELSGDALFQFDRSDLAGLLPGGQGRLDALAQELLDYAGLRELQIIGHTDRLGSESYNRNLSERRAETVAAYLRQRGVRVSIRTQGAGESQPTAATSQCVGERATPALKACLQPDRRVQLQLGGDSAPSAASEQQGQ